MAQEDRHDQEQATSTIVRLAARGSEDRIRICQLEREGWGGGLSGFGDLRRAKSVVSWSGRAVRGRACEDVVRVLLSMLLVGVVGLVSASL